MVIVTAVVIARAINIQDTWKRTSAFHKGESNRLRKLLGEQSGRATHYRDRCKKLRTQLWVERGGDAK